MNKHLLAIVFFLYCSFQLSAQNFNKNDFFEADMALVSNDYGRAQKIFGKLLESAPDNANLNFLNGLCLINLPGRKKESLQYLQKAAPNISSEYKYGDPEEESAPTEVIKYFAMACKLNNNIPKAIELFNQYKSLLGPKEEDEKALTDAMIESCYTAIRLQEAPVFFKKSELGESLKGDQLYSYPVINNDETMLFYAVRGQYNRDEIYFVQNIGGTWGEPVKITTLLGVKGECYPSSVSNDNQRLYLTVKTGVSTDIYYSVYEKDRWQKMIELDKPVNGSGWDSQASESPDGMYLYFSSDRKGGLGNMDLYMSAKDEKGGWAKPVNLGAVINTPQNELMPLISSDQTKLFFKSEAHENLGGYDIFESKQTGVNEWGQPKNIGYPVNSTDDDIFFMPVRNGDYAYAVLQNSADPGRNELCLLEIFSETHPRKFEISGQVVLNEAASGTENTTIEVYNTKNYETVTTLHPGTTGNYYSFEVPSGSYMINFISPDYKTFTQLVDLPIDFPDNTLAINAVLEREMPVAAVVPVIVEAPAVEETTQTKSIIEEIDQNSKDTPQLFQPAEPVQTEYPASVKDKKIDYSPALSYDGKYTVQFLALRKQINLTEFRSEYPVEIQEGNDGYFRYVTGVFDSPADAIKIHDEIVENKFRDAFVREYNLNDYLDNAAKSASFLYTIQIAAVHNQTDLSNFKELSHIKVSYGEDSFYRYTIGEFSTLTAAQKELENIISKGYAKAYIKKIAEVSNYR